MNRNSFIEIKKIILKPLFTWTHPSEWGTRFGNQHLMIKVMGYTKSAGTFSFPVTLGQYLRSDSYHPVFALHQPILISSDYNINEYPIRIEVVLSAYTPETVIDFDVMFVYDER